MSNLKSISPTLATHRDRVSGLIIGFEGATYVTPALNRFMRDTDRYKDICGKDIGYVMPKTGWYAAGLPACIAAYEPHEEHQSKSACAAAWCMPIVWHDGRSGINFSYATGEKHTGQGLAKLLSSAAFMWLDEAPPLGIPNDAQINIQCDESNLGSIGVAQSMGFSRAPENDFCVQTLDRQFLAFSITSADFRQYASAICAQRIECEQSPTHAEQERPRAHA